MKKNTFSRLMVVGIISLMPLSGICSLYRPSYIQMMPLVHDSIPNEIGRSGDARISYLINNRKWFDLNRELSNISPASVTPGLYLMAKSVVSHYFNRSDIACSSIYELLTQYQSEIGYDNSINMTVILAMNFAREKQYETAATQMRILIDQLEQYGKDSVTIANYRKMEKRFKAFAKKGNVCNALHKPGRYRIPFTYFNDMHEAVGRDGHAIMINGNICGKKANMVFDTGAGINIISSRDAKKFGLQATDITMDMTGVGKQTGHLAWADNIRIGNMSWQNVPFFIVDMKTGDSKTDSAGTMLPPVIGLPIMQSMGEIQFDFVKHELTVPAKPTPNPIGYSNVMLGDEGNLVIEGKDYEGTAMYLAFDTGSYFSDLSPHWYFLHREYVEKHGTLDSITVAGIGGINRRKSYILPKFTYTLGKGTAVLDSVRVDTGIDLHSNDSIKVNYGDSGKKDGFAGLNLLERYKRVIFSLKDMYINGYVK